MKNQWKVGELAKLAGLTIRTLRYYDQIGLFSPSGHTDSGHRIYNEADISQLQQILSLKELGLSLEEVKGILDGDEYSPLEIVSIQIERIKDNIRSQQKLLEQLESVSGVMQAKEPLTAQDFTKLLSMMKKSHEKYFLERRTSMEHSLDRLGDFLASGNTNEDTHPRRQK